MTIDELVHTLADADAELRRRAVLQLRATHAGSDAWLLGELCLRALGDADWRVRKEAIDVVCARADELSLVPGVIAALAQGENIGLRNAALDVCARLGARVEVALVNALADVPEHARKFVIEALGDTGSPYAIPELARAARGEDVNVASEAIEALSHIGGAQAENEIRAQLGNKSALLRVAALEALNRREALVPWEELAPLLEDSMLRRVALSALGRTGRMEALAPLFAALAEPSPGVVARAAVSISALLASSPQAHARADEHLAEVDDQQRALMRSLLHPGQDLEVRRSVVELLLRARDELALGAVVEHFAEDAASPAAVRGLRAWGSLAVTPLLALAARHPSPQGRATALELAADLSQLDSADGFPAPVRAQLLRALDDLEAVVVQAACRCLAEGGGRDDARALGGHLVGASQVQAKQISRALSRLAERFPREVEEALPAAGARGVSGVALASVLSSMGAPALPRLQVLLTDDDADVRRAAVHALGKVGGARAQSLVPIALADESAEVQVAAAQVLGSLRGENGEACAVDDLLQALSSPMPQVQAASARALGQTGSPLALEPLRALIVSIDPGLAIAAVEAMGALGAEALVEELRAALGHRDPEVVKTALRVAAETGERAAVALLVQALDHAAWDVRKLSAELLGAADGDSARVALRERRARERDTLVNEAIDEALRALEGEG